MKDGFIRAAAAAPRLKVADCRHNAAELIRIAQAAEADGVRLLVFPELSLTACTCGDLFFSRTLLDAAEAALVTYLRETAGLALITVLGLPVPDAGRLYTCAAVCMGGKLLGLVPKTEISRDEARYFAPGEVSRHSFVFAGMDTALLADQLFCCETMPELCLAVEFGDAMSVRHAAAGATVIARLAAEPEIVGAAEYRRHSVVGQSARCCCGYIYAGAGDGESTTDFVFAGHGLIAERGVLLGEHIPFSRTDYIAAELDAAMLRDERMRRCNWPAEHAVYAMQTFSLPVEETGLTRTIDPYPFVPADSALCAKRCAEILQIQTHGLATRIERAYARSCVIGISGGLDSALALLVSVEAMALLGRDRRDIIAVTMPCFGTTLRTRTNAEQLCEALGVTLRVVDIKGAVDLHFADIGHDPALHDVVYENSQARERTQILMDIANAEQGMVIGTGDLSELALGWATYNGDHMSNYAVNADVPKTLVRCMVGRYADAAEARGEAALAACLRDIVDTPVSPELLPPDDGEIAQRTEDLVGPYALHDFFLFHFLRHGFAPAKLYRLACAAFADIYDRETILHWLAVFHRRFVSQQFKRSCMPDGPRIGTVCLSPRGGWQMPSDASSSLWLAEIERLRTDCK